MSREIIVRDLSTGGITRETDLSFGDTARETSRAGSNHGGR